VVAEGTEDDRDTDKGKEGLIGGGTRVTLTGTEVMMVVVRGGETEVTVEVIVVIVSKEEGAEGAEPVPETLRLRLRLRLREEDAEAETEDDEPELDADTAAHKPSKIVLTCAWSSAEHDVVPAHCSTLDAKDVLHKQAVSDRLHFTVAAAWLAQPCAHCGRVVA